MLQQRQAQRVEKDEDMNKVIDKRYPFETFDHRENPQYADYNKQMSKIKGYENKHKSQADKKHMENQYPKGEAGLAYYEETMNKNREQFMKEDDKVIKETNTLKARLQQGLEDYEEVPADDPDQKNRKEMNLDLNYWKNKFLYPYALNLAPLKLPDSGLNHYKNEQDTIQQNRLKKQLQ